MKKRTRIILVISVAAVLLGVLAIMFFNSDIWGFIRYRYLGNYVPPTIEAALLDKVHIEDGELLSEEELNAFWEEWGEESFYGYYDTMPDNLRGLTASFTERINTRYGKTISYLTLETLSPSQISVQISTSPEVIYFSFFGDTFFYVYAYTKGHAAVKRISHILPSELTIEPRTITNGEAEVPSYDIGRYLTYAIYDHQMVRLCTMESKTGNSPYVVKQIATADFDEYMRAVKAGEPGADNPGDKLSLDRIEKHMAAKRK